MTQPTAYARSTAFADEESSNVGGRSTVRTGRVDAELDAIALTLGQVLTNLALIQRDDTKLKDSVVELHTLSSAVLALLTSYGATPRGPWVTATAYAIKDLVTQSGNTYMCVTAHTSGTFATDLATSKWILFSLGTAIGAAAVSFAPTATLAATNVQAAIDESDTENRALSAAASTAISTLTLNLADPGSGGRNIGFQRNATGAVASNYEEWLQRSIISAFDFMTDAQIADVQARTRTLDLTTPLQNFFNACASSIGFMPPGDYRHDSSLTARTGMQINGAGIGATVLYTSNDIKQVVNDAATTYSVTFRDLTVYNAHAVVDTAGPSTTATVTNGSPDITVASATGLAKGIKIAGTGIPANTYIRLINGTTVSLGNAAGASVNATASGAGVAITTTYREGPTNYQFDIFDGGKWLLDNVRFRTAHGDNDYSPTNKAGASFTRTSVSSYFVNTVRDCWFDHAQLLMGTSDSDIVNCTVWSNPHDFAIKLCAPNIRVLSGSVSAGVDCGVWITATGTEPNGANNHSIVGVNIDGGDIWYSGHGIRATQAIGLQVRAKFNNVRRSGLYLDTCTAPNWSGSTFLNGNQDGNGHDDVTLVSSAFQTTGANGNGCTHIQTAAKSPTTGYAIREVNSGFDAAGGSYCGNSISSNYQSPAFLITTPVSTGQYPKVSGNSGGGVETETIANSVTNKFTATLTGCTTSPTGDVYWSRSGDLVTLRMPQVFATSNSTSCTLTGMPASIRPTTQQTCVAFIIDNSVNQIGYVDIATGGTITLHTAATGLMTNVNSKGMLACSITYQLKGA